MMTFTRGKTKIKPMSMSDMSKLHNAEDQSNVARLLLTQIICWLLLWLGYYGVPIIDVTCIIISRI